MSFADSILATIAPRRMLAHPFYRAWEMGELELDVLKTYARQYYHHVKAFPRYLSATHANCSDINSRRVLLENLIDEEHGETNHPELWLRFAEGIGNTRIEAESEELQPGTRALIDTFMQLARSSYAEGLGALFAYEQQIPAVAHTKADGLRKFYGVADERTVSYFTLHEEVDVHHSAATRKLIDELPAEDRAKALRAAEEVSEALWGFLDGMQAIRPVVQ